MANFRSILGAFLSFSGISVACGKIEEVQSSGVTLQQPVSELKRRVAKEISNETIDNDVLTMRRESRNKAQRRRHRLNVAQRQDGAESRETRQSGLVSTPPHGDAIAQSEDTLESRWEKATGAYGDAIAQSVDTLESRWEKAKGAMYHAVYHVAAATAGMVIKMDRESKRKSKGRVGVIEILASCAALASFAGFVIARCMFRSRPLARRRASLPADDIQGRVTRAVIDEVNRPDAELVENAAPAPQTPDGADAAAGGPQLQNQGNAEFNRQQYLRNRREAEAQAWEQAISDSQALFCAIALWPVILLFGFVYFWARGWDVWWHFGGSECDQPLGTWLFITLLWPFWPRGSPWAALMALLLWLTLGVVWLNQTVTCSRTAPELFDFVRLLLIVLAALWVMLLTGCLAVRIAMDCLLYCGFILKTRAEILDFIETVTYNPALFAPADNSGASSSSDDLPPGECCCCVEAFDDVKAIKYTPCKHYFHEECLGKWMRVSPTCPLCRTDLVEAVRVRQEQMEASGET